MFGGTVTKICCSKVKSANMSGDNTPTAVDWANLNDCGPQPFEPFGGTVVVQITGISSTISLHLEMYTGPTYTTNFNREFWYRASVSSFSRVVCGGNGFGFSGAPEYPDYTYINQYNTTPVPFTVSNNNYLAFAFSASPAPMDMLVKVVNRSDAYAILDTFYVYLESSCFLTSALVSHMGLADNGPELSAMRRLRDHYRNVPGYDAILAEYSQVSQQIISNVEASGNTDSEYGYIHSVVSSVVDAVAQGEWQQAHDLYMAMYNDLKSRYANS